MLRQCKTIIVPTSRFDRRSFPAGLPELQLWSNLFALRMDVSFEGS